LHPYVSPVYGDYTKGYPPTLLQGGVKEHMLSNFARLYQAMDMARVNVKLDLYEGMPHVFQAVAHLPESKVALGKVAAFLKQYLG
jgi:acetyl esterase/lipase